MAKNQTPIPQMPFDDALRKLMSAPPQAKDAEEKKARLE
jgi:hypothetical protein